MNDVDFPVARVLAGIDAAADAGLPVKVNVVVKRGLNEASILDIARRFRGTGHTVRFIEFMDVGATNGWRLDDVVPAAEIVSTDRRRVPARAGRGRVPRRGRRALPLPATARGEIGVIASVTQPFCGDCTRARLSADGKLYTCLFAISGHDLRALLRSDPVARARGHDPRRVDAAHRPLLGDPHRGHIAPCARSRCRTSAARAQPSAATAIWRCEDGGERSLESNAPGLPPARLVGTDAGRPKRGQRTYGWPDPSRPTTLHTWEVGPPSTVTTRQRGSPTAQAR